MTWLLHRYRPFTIAALADLAKQDIADRRFAAYAADMSWLIASRLSRGRLELEPPSRIALEGDPLRCTAREDKRSGRQILSDLKAKLLGGKQAGEQV